MGCVTNFKAGNWGRPGLPGTNDERAAHEGRDLVADCDYGGDRWSVSGGYLAVGPDGLHLAPGVVITGQWTIRGPGFAGG